MEHDCIDAVPFPKINIKIKINMSRINLRDNITSTTTLTNIPTIKGIIKILQ
jgi:hypothetical protein